MDVESTQDPNIFRVASESNYNKKYMVDLSDKTHPTCTCTNWAIQTNKAKAGGITDPSYKCKHIIAVDGDTQAAKVRESAAKKRAQDEANAEYERIRAAVSLEEMIKDLT